MLDRSLFGTNAANFGFEVPTNPTEPTAPTTPNGSIVPTVDPGQDPSQAYDLGVLTDSLIVQESVGGNDIGDLYQFTVSTPGEYGFTLEGLSADADFGIIDSNGQVIASSATDGIVEEMFSETLDAGTYYLVVDSYDGAPTDYTLSLNSVNGSEPTAPTTPTDPTIPTEPTAPTTPTDPTIPTEPTTPTTPTDPTIPTEPTAPTTPTDPTIPTEPTTPTTPTDPTIPTEPTAPTTPTDPGDTLDTASDLGLFSGDSSITIQQTVGSSDFVDLYQFTVDQSNDLSITLDGLSGDVDLYLYDSNGELLAGSATDGTVAESFSGTIESGTYFLEVYSYDGIDTNYDLTLSPLEVDATADAFAVSDDLSFA
jgi:hypothetical protein